MLKFFAAGVTFYGMATFEGPLLSIKSVSGLAHYTDWIIGHVHSGGLGWNGLMAAGMFYWCVPRLYGTKLYSRSAANFHFWIATVGILIYVIAMWVAGITQGLMWRAVSDTGGLLYPNFVETYLAIRPMYWARLISGILYIAGILLMAWNLIKTARSGSPVDGEIEVAVVTEPRDKSTPWPKLIFGQPVTASIIIVALFMGTAFFDGLVSTILALMGLMWAVAAVAVTVRNRGQTAESWHSALEGRAGVFTALVVIGILIGGIAEIISDGHLGSRADANHEERPLHSSRARGARRVPSRGLLHVPFADDSALHLGERAVRRGLHHRRFNFRSSIPMGLSPNRSGPRSRRRQVRGRLALQAHDQPA